MAQLTMYPAKAGSKRTTLTADLAIDGTQAFVGDLSAFPAAPNLATFKSDETVWETCLYTAKSAEYGAGYLTITRSGEGHDSSSSGGALSWSSGALVFRSPTALDHDRFKTNIEDLAANKQPLNANLTSIAGVSGISALVLSLLGTTTTSAIRTLVETVYSTVEDMIVYVDSAATGTGTGVDWANAFTTIKAAVNSLPAVINHAVTIIIREGSTPYDENITIQRVIAAGSIVIRGEYYWYGTVAASKTGKITVGVSDYGYADRAQIAVGDVIWATKWSGTVNASTPSESIIDTVASVSGTEVSLTTNTGKTFDTTWTYQIVKTEISTILCRYTDFVTITGLSFKGGGINLLNIYNCTGVIVSFCYFSPTAKVGNGQLIRIESSSNVYPITRCCVDSTYSDSRGLYIVVGPYSNLNASVINLTGASTIGVVGSNGAMVKCSYSHIKAAGVGIMATKLSFIERMSSLNESTTPNSPATNPGPDGGYIV